MTKVIWVSLILCLALSNCKKDKTAATATACTNQNCAAVSFKADIIPIFNQNCATSNICHAGSNNISDNLNLDSTVAYAQATQAGKNLVNANSPSTSILYTQLAPGVYQHMPQNGQLDSCTIQKIYCWIVQGALNN